MDIDYARCYRPESIAGLYEQAAKQFAPAGRSGVVVVASRLGISRGYAYKLLAGDCEPRYPIQVMLERLLEPDGPEVVDAEGRHAPGTAPMLVKRAEAKVGNQGLLAARLGVSRDYLRKLANGQRKMPYGTQVMLEELAHRPPQ